MGNMGSDTNNIEALVSKLCQKLAADSCSVGKIEISETITNDKGSQDYNHAITYTAFTVSAEGSYQIGKPEDVVTEHLHPDTSESMANEMAEGLLDLISNDVFDVAVQVASKGGCRIYISQKNTPIPDLKAARAIRHKVTYAEAISTYNEIRDAGRAELALVYLGQIIDDKDITISGDGRDFILGEIGALYHGQCGKPDLSSSRFADIAEHLFGRAIEKFYGDTPRRYDATQIAEPVAIDDSVQTCFQFGELQAQNP